MYSVTFYDNRNSNVIAKYVNTISATNIIRVKIVRAGEYVAAQNGYPIQLSTKIGDGAWVKDTKIIYAPTNYWNASCDIVYSERRASQDNIALVKVSQKDNETITVKADEVSYMDSFECPIGTILTASVSANTGYTAGAISITPTGNTVTGDKVITAAKAK